MIQLFNVDYRSVISYCEFVFDQIQIPNSNSENEFLPVILNRWVAIRKWVGEDFQRVLEFFHRNT